MAPGTSWMHHGWGSEVMAARATEPPSWTELRRSDRAPIHPLRVCAALQPHLDAGAVLVCDGGEFGQWIQAGAEAPVRLINGLSGSIGSALPMAIAARLAFPGRTVFAALGDGTFGFHPFELDTAARYALPVVVVVGNDARWNAEHQLQLQRYGPERTVGCELRPTGYEAVAAALGGHGERVERAQDLEPRSRAGDRSRPTGLPQRDDRGRAGAHVRRRRPEPLARAPRRKVARAMPSLLWGADEGEGRAQNRPDMGGRSAPKWGDGADDPGARGPADPGRFRAGPVPRPRPGLPRVPLAEPRRVGRAGRRRVARAAVGVRSARGCLGARLGLESRQGAPAEVDAARGLTPP